MPIGIGPKSYIAMPAAMIGFIRLSQYAPNWQIQRACSMNNIFGSVSFIVEYAGLKVIFGGNTSPNKWFVEYAKYADVVIHESFNPPGVFATLGAQPAQLAWRT